MRTPVIIAAHNEERLIGLCLDKLDADLEPIVVANGCEDNTAGIARQYGATVIDLPEPGKLPAIQRALASLGSRSLEPVLYTDSDSYPLWSKTWAKHMTTSVLGSEASQGACGPLGYFDTSVASDSVRSLKRAVDVRRVRNHGGTKFWGNNMATRFNTETLDAVMDMPHIWPGEDRAIELKILEHGGTSTQVTKLGATIMTSARYMLPLSHIAKVGHDVARKEALRDYLDRSAPNSISLGKYLKETRKQTKQ